MVLSLSLSLAYALCLHITQSRSLFVCQPRLRHLSMVMVICVIVHFFMFSGMCTVSSSDALSCHIVFRLLVYVHVCALYISVHVPL